MTGAPGRPSAQRSTPGPQPAFGMDVGPAGIEPTTAAV